IHFSTYPGAIFQGGVRVFLFTLVPAGFLNTMPVEIMRRFDPLFAAECLGAAAVFAGLAWQLFAAGLRRYESGNLLQMRG
ncbi:MAG TPA: ABC-2 family transporter protein, partial [Limnochordia bacterium]|nr:ABC-2 family transporter protein [Limnochordia bacterium]